MQEIDSQIQIDCPVKVSAKTIYLDEYSNAAQHKYLYCYQITIKNEGDKTVQLINRHWRIIDSNSKEEEVTGPGVVGQQPVLEPGRSHQYYSFCNLETNFGSMEGSYEMQYDDGSVFLAPIPRFFVSETLNEFEGPLFKRGEITKEKNDNFRAVIVDYDMYFINDEELYNKHPDKPAKDKPWYYILIDGTNAISYVPQEVLIKDENLEEFDHSLVDFFFDGFDGEFYKRNEKSWEELRRA